MPCTVLGSVAALNGTGECTCSVTDSVLLGSLLVPLKYVQFSQGRRYNVLAVLAAAAAAS